MDAMKLLQTLQGIDLSQANLQEKVFLAGITSVCISEVITKAFEFFVLSFMNEAIHEGLPLHEVGQMCTVVALWLESCLTIRLQAQCHVGMYGLSQVTWGDSACDQALQMVEHLCQCKKKNSWRCRFPERVHQELHVPTCTG